MLRGYTFCVHANVAEAGAGPAQQQQQQEQLSLVTPLVHIVNSHPQQGHFTSSGVANDCWKIACIHFKTLVFHWQLETAEIGKASLFI